MPSIFHGPGFERHAERLAQREQLVVVAARGDRSAARCAAASLMRRGRAGIRRAAEPSSPRRSPHCPRTNAIAAPTTPHFHDSGAIDRKKTALPSSLALSGAAGPPERIEHRRQREAEDAEEGHDHQDDERRDRRRRNALPKSKRHQRLAAEQQNEDREQRDAAGQDRCRAASASTASWMTGPSARSRDRRPCRAGRRASARCRRGSRRRGTGPRPRDRAGRRRRAGRSVPRRSGRWSRG